MTLRSLIVVTLILPFILTLTPSFHHPPTLTNTSLTTPPRPTAGLLYLSRRCTRVLNLVPFFSLGFGLVTDLFTPGGKSQYPSTQRNGPSSLPARFLGHVLVQDVLGSSFDLSTTT